MSIIKRSPDITKKSLVEAMEKFAVLLDGQEEDEAGKLMRKLAVDLQTVSPTSSELKKVIAEVIEAFEGDHELISYTYQREASGWTEVEELSQVSARVLSLARRLK